MTYIIRDREAGNEIERVETLTEAEKLLREFEQADKEEGDYTEGFYEIAVDHGYRQTQNLIKGGYTARRDVLATEGYKRRGRKPKRLYERERGRSYT